MRVLQVTSSSQRRGAEVFAQQLGEALAERGHDVSTVALRADGSRADLPFVQLPPGRFSASVLRELTVRSRWADVVVAHGGSTLQTVAVTSMLARRPFVYRNIGDPRHWGAARLSALRIGAPLRRAAAVAALYDSSARYLCDRYRLQPRRVTVLGNAVPSTQFPTPTAEDRAAARSELGLDQGTPLVGYLGALSPEKRPEWMIELANRLPEVTVRVAGDGPLRADLVRATSNTGAPANIGLLDPPTDAATFLAALDVLVVPSRTEGVPGVILEAALTGTPVVATDVGGVADTMSSLAFGRTVDADDLDGLAAAVRRVLADPEAFTAERARVVEAHDLAALEERWETLLRHAVEG
jgi:glycosyltransferase involved in cell wall biosynthesis